MQTIIVDMTPGFRMPTIYYSQGDVGTQFAIDLRSRFGNSFPTGTTVTIQATKPSGFGFSVAATSVTNGVATFTTTAEMTDEFGRFPAELKVTKTGLTLFTANFYMDGERNTHPEGTTDGSQETVIPELTQLVERVENAASSVLDMTVEAETLAAGSDATYSYDEETNTATFGIPKGADGSLASGVLAPTYSSSSTYAVGDYVYYSGSLYRCTTAITTAEAWTSGHWTQVALAPEVSDLKSAISDIEEYLNVDFTNLFIASNATNNKRVFITDGSEEGAVSGYYASDYMPVIAGKDYVINFSYWSSGNYGMAFYDSSKTFVSGLKQSATTSGSPTRPFYFSVPTGCAYIKITVDTGVNVSNVVVQMVNGNINDLLDVEKDYVQIKAESTEIGYYINSSGNKTTASDWGILSYSVAAGEHFRVTSRSAGPVGTIFVTNNNNDKLMIVTGNLTNYEFLIPEDGTILKVSNAWSYGIPAVVEKYTTPTNDKLIFEVDCYGDSLTFGNQDGTGVNYPMELWKLVNPAEWSYGKYGFGGDGSAEIACMQGGIPMYVMPFTIPATTTPVAINLKCGDTSFTDSFVPADQNISYLNDVIISGIVGAITLSSGIYYFTRAEAGSETEVSRPALVFTKGYTSRNNVQVIWAGTNDTLSISNIQTLVDRINSMVNFIESQKYIVVSLTCKDRFSDIEQINGYLSRVFGSHFVNVRDYILAYGLADANITPTSQDTTDIANGEIPTSLRHDTVHLNQYGYKIVANLVYRKGKDLGYWE